MLHLCSGTQAARVMASLPQLLILRLPGEAPPYDESVALRRILANYYAGNEHTLVDFLHLGAAVISVVPFERTAT